MVNCKSWKAALQYTARTGLADFLQSIRDVLVAASARAAAMQDCVHEHQESQNRQQAEHIQVFCYSALIVYLL
jgi:hypothetical protein